MAEQKLAFTFMVIQTAIKLYRESEQKSFTLSKNSMTEQSSASLSKKNTPVIISEAVCTLF